MKPVETAEQKIERLEKWIADLQSGMYINCVYCGHQYGREDKVPATMADVLKQHIAKCPEHPMHALLEVAKGAWHMCQSGLHNERNDLCQISHDLVKEMSDGLRSAIDKAELVKPTPTTEKAKSKKQTARKARAR